MDHIDILLLETELSNYLKKYDLTFVTIDDNDSLKRIHDLFLKDIVFESTTAKSPVELAYLGVYYEIHETPIKNSLSKEYYLEAIKGENIMAMNNLAYIYENEKEYRLAEKYYLMAIEHKCKESMNNLATMYDDEKKYDLAKKYYLMSIEHNYNKAMHNLAVTYNNEGNYDLAKKYYIMALKQNYVRSFVHLIKFHNYRRDEQAETIDIIIKYSSLANRTDVIKSIVDVWNNLNEDASCNDKFVQMISKFEFNNGHILPNKLSLLINLVKKLKAQV